MKKFVMMCLLLGMFVISVSGTAQEPGVNTGTITVVVTGIKNNDGLIMMALSNSEENYHSKEESPYLGMAGEIQNKQSTLVVEDLPFGEYAIKLFHDANENGEMDFNFLGIPKEDYAFSNNAKGALGLPKYNKAKFEFKENMTIEISMSSKENAE